MAQTDFSLDWKMYEPRRHRFYEFFKARRQRIPQKIAATWIGVSPVRLSQVLCGHSVCPKWIDEKLNQLVNIIKFQEENERICNL